MTRRKDAYIEVEANSWEDIRECGQAFQAYTFRGQSRADWPLKTTIERAADLYESLWIENEALILEDFKRRAPYYLDHLPPEDQPLEWASLLQHFGAPTRLLDVTDSFYVALYFAIEAGPFESAVWAFDAPRLLVNASPNKILTVGFDLHIHRDDPDARAFVNEHYAEDGPLGVVQVRPFYLHPRLRMQQGSFLYQVRTDSYFERNLCECFEIQCTAQQSLPSARQVTVSELPKRVCFTAGNRAHLVKLRIKPATHASAMAELRRMNISSEALFPGLDGFVRSLRYPFQLANRAPRVLPKMSGKNSPRKRR
jgi:hypothetical protein